MGINADLDTALLLLSQQSYPDCFIDRISRILNILPEDGQRIDVHRTAQEFQYILADNRSLVNGIPLTLDRSQNRCCCVHAGIPSMTAAPSKAGSSVSPASSTRSSSGTCKDMSGLVFFCDFQMRPSVSFDSRT